MISRCSERTKQSDPCVFALQRENFRCSVANLGFQFLGLLAATKNCLVETDNYCPSNNECMCCSEKESRCSGDNLPSPLLARPTAVPNFLAIAVVQGLPPKFQSFFLTIGATSLQQKFYLLQRSGISLQRVGSVFPSLWCLVGADLSLAAISILCL